ncbi:hypothetical protein G7Y89_g3545 [Cudoniella acicularis]|uniref:Uncharacterized protein n=1 Tax=Cudoniella acicularis TaxID=354080 RepID=A0A8H4W5V6_9HELO|nr:hypothetical protein G7Y89_g3545 [Cudoniella acicularis]
MASTGSKTATVETVISVPPTPTGNFQDLGTLAGPPIPEDAVLRRPILLKQTDYFAVSEKKDQRLFWHHLYMEADEAQESITEEAATIVQNALEETGKTHKFCAIDHEEHKKLFSKFSESKLKYEQMNVKIEAHNKRSSNPFDFGKINTLKYGPWGKIYLTELSLKNGKRFSFNQDDSGDSKMDDSLETENEKFLKESNTHWKKLEESPELVKELFSIYTYLAATEAYRTELMNTDAELDVKDTRSTSLLTEEISQAVTRLMETYNIKISLMVNKKAQFKTFNDLGFVRVPRLHDSILIQELG